MLFVFCAWRVRTKSIPSYLSPVYFCFFLDPRCDWHFPLLPQKISDRPGYTVCPLHPPKCSLINISLDWWRTQEPISPAPNIPFLLPGEPGNSVLGTRRKLTTRQYYPRSILYPAPFVAHLGGFDIVWECQLLTDIWRVSPEPQGAVGFAISKRGLQAQGSRRELILTVPRLYAIHNNGGSNSSLWHGMNRVMVVCQFSPPTFTLDVDP